MNDPKTIQDFRVALTRLGVPLPGGKVDKAHYQRLYAAAKSSSSPAATPAKRKVGCGGAGSSTANSSGGSGNRRQRTDAGPPAAHNVPLSQQQHPPPAAPSFPPPLYPAVAPGQGGRGAAAYKAGQDVWYRDQNGRWQASRVNSAHFDDPAAPYYSILHPLQAGTTRETVADRLAPRYPGAPVPPGAAAPLAPSVAPAAPRPVPARREASPAARRPPAPSRPARPWPHLRPVPWARVRPYLTAAGVSFGVVVLAALSDEANPLHRPATLVLRLLGAVSRDLLLASVRGLVLVCVSLLTWLIRLVVALISAVVDVLAELTGARQALSSLRSTVGAAADGATAAAAEATSDASESFVTLRTNFIEGLELLRPYVLAAAALAALVGAIVWLVARRLRAHRLQAEARRYVSVDGWLSLRLKAPLSRTTLATALATNGDAPAAAAAAAAAAPIDDEQVEQLQELDHLQARCAELTDSFLGAPDAAATDAAVAERRQLLGRYCCAAADATAAIAALGHASLHARGVVFSWGDAWRHPFEEGGSARGGGAASESDYSFEVAGAMYNFTAGITLHAATLPLDERMNAYQQGVYILSALMELTGAARWTGGVTPDLTADHLRALQAVLLAQATRCVYERAVERNLAAGTLEMLAAEAAAFYADAHAAVRTAAATRSGALAAALPTLEWVHVCEALHLLYAAKSHTHASAADLHALAYGVQVGRLAHAVDLLATAHTKGPTRLQPYLDTHRAAAASVHAAAAKDNDSIYYAAVAAPGALPPPRRPERRLVQAKAPPELIPAGEAPPAEGTWPSPLRALLASPVANRRGKKRAEQQI